MRILFVIHAWHPEGRGGTELHAHAVARALVVRGHQVGIFARTSRPDRPPYEVSTEWQGSLSVTRINNGFLDLHDLQWVYKNRRVHEAFCQELDSFRPDLVHIHHLTGLSTTIIEESKLRRIPTVFSLHDFWTVCPRGQRMQADLSLCEDVERRTCASCLGGMWPHMFPATATDPIIVDARGRLAPAKLAEWDRHMVYALRLCDLLITPSEFHRERMLDFPLDADRIVGLPHGLDHMAFSGALRDAARPPTRIGFLGAITPPKGVHVLLEAFLTLGRPGLSLHLHGGFEHFHEPGYEERLRALAADRSDVIFHGPYQLAQVPELLSRLDVLVIPSLWWETFCLTLREGLLAGIPVLASGHGAMREALEGEQDGLLFRPGDVRDLSEKLVRILDDEALRTRLCNRGRSVKTIERYMGELDELYARACSIAGERAESLVVAPPSFPPDPPPSLPTLVRPRAPWDAVGVSLRHDGPIHVSMATTKPSASAPTVKVDVSVTDGDVNLGVFALEIDLRALAEHLDGSGVLGPSGPIIDAATSTPVPEVKKRQRRREIPGPPGSWRLERLDLDRPRNQRGRLELGRKGSTRKRRLNPPGD